MPEPHLDSRTDEVVRGEVERGTEALDLERPRELAADAVEDAARRERREGEERERDDRGRETGADERLAPPAPPPDVRDDERDEHDRVELRRDAGAEHGEPEPVAVVDERGERPGDERGRPEVEARQDDRAEQERERRR